MSPSRSPAPPGLGHGLGAALALALFSEVALAAMTSCRGDPTLSAELELLGPEKAGVAPGEYHRAGQPCTHCHNNTGTATPEFSVAGTIFANNLTKQAVGVKGVVVRIVDSEGAKFSAETNCVGNFFVSPTQSVTIGGKVFDSYKPSFPLKVVVTYNGQDHAMVNALINRDGSCAGCHKLGPPALDSVGHVYLSTDATSAPKPDDSCPVDPTRDFSALSKP